VTIDHALCDNTAIHGHHGMATHCMGCTELKTRHIAWRSVAAIAPHMHLVAVAAIAPHMHLVAACCACCVCLRLRLRFESLGSRGHG
jgi:hypothetical protein